MLKNLLRKRSNILQNAVIHAVTREVVISTKGREINCSKDGSIVVSGHKDFLGRSSNEWEEISILRGSDPLYKLNNALWGTVVEDGTIEWMFIKDLSPSYIRTVLKNAKPDRWLKRILKFWLDKKTSGK